MKRAALLIPALALLTVAVHANARMVERDDYYEAPPPPPPPPSVYEASNLFAVDLYQRLAADQVGNLVFSPASISLALGMTYDGAAGDTAAQIGGVFHLDQFASAAEAQQAQGEMQNVLVKLGKTKGVELRMANRLWAQEKFPFAKAFLAATKERYGAGLETVNFHKKPDAVRKRINAWVEQQTKKRIKDLLPAGSVDEYARLVLVNAIYLKASWAHKFAKSDTYDGAFMLPAGDTVTVPLMSQSGEAGFAQLDGVTVLEMKYKDSDLAMVFVLPDALDGLPALEQQLTATNLTRWFGALAPTNEVSITLPRFTATTTLALADTLKAMGMPAAFDADNADFSDMLTADANSADTRLYIKGVFHKAFIQVDEAGAEAAAATGVVVGEPTSVARRAKPTFRADHPFVYAIRDTKTGAILFLGRIVDPR